MKGWRALAVVLCLAGVGAAQDAGSKDAGFAFEGAKKVRYKRAGAHDLFLHVFAPTEAAAGRRPAIVFFFGGGWRGGHPRQFEPQCRYLAGRGMVAITAEYRVASRHGATPFDCVADARSAVRWVRAHAAELGVDPDRIAAAGGSAGGHLAACTAAIDAFDAPDEDATVRARPDAMVLFNPVVDTGPTGYGHDRLGERYRDLSPLEHVDRGQPPTLLFHGTGDRTVPFANAEAYRDRMNAAGNRCELLAYEGRNHGFFNARPKTLRDHATTTRAMDRFLGSLGWLTGEPTFAEPGSAVWHGYTRRDLEIAGRKALVVVPDQPAPGAPWIWRARFFGHEPQVDTALLARGFHLFYVDVADLYGNDVALATWDAGYTHATRELGLAPKVVLEGMSRGGLIVYRWAAANADKIACIYADAPVCDIRSWPGGKGAGRGSDAAWRQCLAAHGLDEESAETWAHNPIDVLLPLASARVPLLHVCGDADPVVPFAENTAVLAERYRRIGGRIAVIAKPGVGHHPHSLKDPAPIVRFIERHATGSGDWFTLRGGLPNSYARFAAGGPVRVAFLGGSITHNRGWRDLVRASLAKRFSGVGMSFVNAGIPSFGSTPGAFRLERDVFASGDVDLLFVEAAVNDSTNGRSATEMLRGMEGIVRHARDRNPRIDIVMLHFVDPGKMQEIRRGILPEVIAVHERVAEHYAIPSIDLATEVTDRIDAGEFSWREDFVNLHPSPFGQRLYGASIARLLNAAWWQRGPAKPHAPVAPLDRFSYARGQMLAPAAARANDGFALVPSWQPSDGAGTRAGFVDVPVLVAERPGASTELAFRGIGVGVLVNAGPDAGVLEWRVDGGPWASVDLFTRWSRGLHLPWSHVLAADLDEGPHVLQLRVGAARNAASTGNAVRIARFLVNGG